LSEQPASVRYLTAKDVARMCQVNPKTVVKWVSNGSIRHFRLPGGHLRFHRDELQLFMREHGFLRSWETIPDDETV
jgi:excisionase family DNA binding protein